MSVTIAVESPLQDDVRGLVTALNATMMPLTPREFQFQLTVEQMDDPAITLFIGRDAQGDAVAMGAIKDHGAGLGEVKRMFTRPEIRGSGAGWAVLQAIETKARETGLHRLVLETGEAPGFEEAWKLYERAGYDRCGPVLDYPDSGYNRFYEKILSS